MGSTARFVLIAAVCCFLPCLPSISPTAEEAPVAPAESDGLDAWLAELKKEALAKGIGQGTLDSALGQVEILDRVIELDRNQPEFKLTFDEYLDRVINDKRVRDGRARLARHGALLAEVQQKYNVQPRFIVALWGIESDFGRRTGSFSVIDALASLAYDGRRAEFFRGELLNALTIIDAGDITADAMIGSWAGAMGQTQFMPSSFLTFAVDHDGDSRRDIWGSTADGLASAANYLSGSGWRGDLIWGREVKLPDGFDGALVSAKKKKTIAQWQELGVRRHDGSDLPRVDVTGRIVRPDGEDGPVYLVYANFEVLLKWNRSNYFATAVGILSDRLAHR